MRDIYKQSLEFHKKHKGKIEIRSKSPLARRDDLSLAYTPGVAEVSRVIGDDVSKAYEYTSKQNMVAIVTDGSAILGLGDLGPEAALPVMEGKAALFKEFANVDAFPICLATQDTDTIVETVKLIAPSFGGVNLEDISAPRCFDILARLQNELDIPVMHDDQQGTAVVTLAGLINALKLSGKSKEEARVVISGVGAAGVAITRLLLEYGFRYVVLIDSKGAIHSQRTDLNEIKKELALVTNVSCTENIDDPACVLGSLEDALKGADVFIGVSKPGLVTQEMVATMRDKSIVFALANPEPEIMPDEARAGGAFIVATGRSDFPNQVNNVLAFPGIFRGVFDKRLSCITNDMLLSAAEALAAYTKNPNIDHILPDTLDKKIAHAVARAIA